MPVTGKYGNPAPAGPPMVVQERAPQPSAEETLRPYATLVQIPVRPTATTIREQVEARIAELRTDIATLAEKQSELAKLERALEVL